MKYLKKFNENNNSKLEELKSKIDELSHKELARIWRFGSSDNELLQGEAGEYFRDRLFKHFGGFNPSLSKGIGWDKNETFSFLKRKKNDNDDSCRYSNNSISLESLKKKYPNAIITMNPFDKFPGNFFARVDIKMQNGKEKYLGAIKGPVKEKDALEFFSTILSKNYDKFY
jgi:hypothetical protein